MIFQLVHLWLSQCLFKLFDKFFQSLGFWEHFISVGILLTRLIYLGCHHRLFVDLVAFIIEFLAVTELIIRALGRINLSIVIILGIPFLI